MDAAVLDDFRAGLRRFVEREVAPHVDAWDEAGEFPRELYRRAAALGLLGLGYPEAYGGMPCNLATRLVAVEEIARAGSGGLLASLFSHNIALSPLYREVKVMTIGGGTDEIMKELAARQLGV